MRIPFLTERLRLRDIREPDAGPLLELDSDPKVMRYIGTRPSDSVDWYRERIRNVYLPWQEHAWQGIWIVESLSDNMFLGWTFIRPAHLHANADALGWQPNQVEIGYRFHSTAWGRGIATEAGLLLVDRALADPAIHAIVGCAVATNLSSIRVLEKLGLHREGETMIADHPEPIVKLVRWKAPHG